MAKYYRFEYSAGYCGTEVKEIIKFPDDVDEEYVSEFYSDWYEEKNTAHGRYKEISEEEAERDGIDQDYTE